MNETIFFKLYKPTGYLRLLHEYEITKRNTCNLPVRSTKHGRKTQLKIKRNYLQLHGKTIHLELKRKIMADKYMKVFIK